ncbi:hypothetical protein SLEP1_g9963 [Rubroshorea leprosula]|uniref:Uncharacterized protein n=1 Tax=Rubroshorea leprosula TaxID=152421 RepID=A0AAV5I6L9_9ROSI|nr:hypothetical protein SLEP1_g9963 [Rubroshorea leprosula]
MKLPSLSLAHPLQCSDDSLFLTLPPPPPPPPLPRRPPPPPPPLLLPCRSGEKMHQATFNWGG